MQRRLPNVFRACHRAPNPVPRAWTVVSFTDVLHQDQGADVRSACHGSGSVGWQLAVHCVRNLSLVLGSLIVAKCYRESGCKMPGSCSARVANAAGRAHALNTATRGASAAACASATRSLRVPASRSTATMRVVACIVLALAAVAAAQVGTRSRRVCVACVCERARDCHVPCACRLRCILASACAARVCVALAVSIMLAEPAQALTVSC